MRLGPDRHHLIVVLHHVVADGWSLGVLFDEVAALYQAGAAEVPAALPELPVQYADYAVWQREWLGSSAVVPSVAYFRQHLKGVPVLELPTDRPRPPQRSFRGGMQRAELPPDLVEALERLARREGVTLFMLLLATFQMLLARLTGRTRWLWARRSPTAGTWRSRGSSASSSTPSSWTPAAGTTRRSMSYWRGRAGPAWGPMPIRTSPSSAWSRSSTRCATWGAIRCSR